jgi:hypothetical protein
MYFLAYARKYTIPYANSRLGLSAAAGVCRARRPARPARAKSWRPETAELDLHSAVRDPR